MKRVVVPAIPYDSSGWRDNGFYRVKADMWTPKCYERGYELAINLGKGPVHPHSGIPIVYNAYPVTRATNDLQQSQHLFGSLMPPTPAYGDPFWVKTPGYGGVGKECFPAYHGYEPPSNKAILQKHVEGVEYRVITVGPMVVQVFRKDKKPYGGVGDFDWTWVGVSVAASIVGLIPTAKSAAAILSNYVGHDRHIIGWDIIRDEYQRAWLIEGNSAPGCNDKTAARIWAAIQTLEKLNGISQD